MCVHGITQLSVHFLNGREYFLEENVHLIHLFFPNKLAILFNKLVSNSARHNKHAANDHKANAKDKKDNAGKYGAANRFAHRQLC